jgi:hypothetical protein
MSKRIVDAILKDGTVHTYRIGLRPARMRFTDEEYLGIAKQYHVEDSFPLDAVGSWVLHPLDSEAKTCGTKHSLNLPAPAAVDRAQGRGK